MAVVRRLLGALAVVLAVGGLLTACQDEFRGLKLTVATGFDQGVYYVLGSALADAWAGQLRIERPAVRTTAGSVDNLDRLRTGQADVGFSAADAASDFVTQQHDGRGGRRVRALARMHDDYVQLVVRQDSATTRLADLRNLRVSIGPPSSGVEVIAKRLLAVAAVDLPDANVRHLSINDSLQALRDNQIDAFFWSGGLPTPGVTDLARTVPLRMVDLGDLVSQVRSRWPVYGSATVPASAYGLRGSPITTLVVPNFLLVTDAMPDSVAEALVRGLFDAQPALARANPAAKSIDARSAIETTPVPLHPGAEHYYRSIKV